MKNPMTAWLRCLPAAFLLLASSACTQAPAAAQPLSDGPGTAGLADGDYYIVSKLSYKPMTAVRTADGQVLVVQHRWSAQRDAAQVWSVKHVEDGYALVSNQYQQALVIADASAEAGAVASLSDDANGPGQRWLLQPHMDSYSIVAAHSGKALGVSGAFREEGAEYLQWAAPSDADNELFMFVRADAQARGRHAFDTDPLSSARYDNEAGLYHLPPLLPAALEADRLRQMKLMEYHPSGLYVEQGETVQLEVTGLSPDRDALVVMVGPANKFMGATPRSKPMQWLAAPGHNQFTATRSGMLYFRYIDSGFGRTALPAVDVQVLQGGTPVPFYIAGQTQPDQWRHQLATRDTPYVEMIGPRSAITVRRDMLDRSDHADPASLLDYLEEMIRHHDAISGLDGSSEYDRPAPLRLHYQQDDQSSAKAVEGIFMYADDYFIGMPQDSPLALLNDPARSDPWGLWHEAGHIYQQSDWTWGAVTEVTVNIYSLHAQERFGLPTRLREVDPDTGMSSVDWAEQYLAQDERNFNDDASFAQSSAVSARLVMYQQMRNGLGDGFFHQLHKYYRRQPLDFAQRSDENTLIQQFIYRSCLVARQDLSTFFVAWGMTIDADTASRIDELQLSPAPDLLALPE